MKKNLLMSVTFLAASGLENSAVQAHFDNDASAYGVTSTQSAETSAAAMVDAMTLPEQISLLRTQSGATLLSLGIELPPTIPEMMRQPKPEGAIGSAGFVAGIPRVGMPAQQMSDASLGVADLGFLRPGDHATSLPSTLALAATFDADLAREAGRMIGTEAHAKGFNIQLAGGVNLVREPRNGRNFEYFSEDPLLSGVMAGEQIAGIQDKHVVSTIKHYALNAQETGRLVHNAIIDDAAFRESDLLAFEIAIERGAPGAVMCAYNRVNSEYACESDYLLKDILKGDWAYKGWVMSDWGAVHSLDASVMAGLDQQSPQGTDGDYFAKLEAAVLDGRIPAARVRDMALRIVRALHEVGAIDHPAKPGGNVDIVTHAAISRSVAEKGSVLLKNDGLLPLTGKEKTIAVIGGHADKGVPIGGGSSQVIPYGGIYRDAPAGAGLAALMAPTYGLSSPLKALEAKMPGVRFVFNDGADTASAAAAAKDADVAIVFAVRTEMEGIDHADLSLPKGQDALIEAVAAANNRTAVVLEIGNPATMPWLEKVGAVLVPWFSGQCGGDVIAALLTGETSPSGRLPITFPASTDQLPRKQIVGFDPAKQRPLSIGVTYEPFDIIYEEGSDVGYRWFEKAGAKPLFPFGYGLTYTNFDYADLKTGHGSDEIKISFRLTNTGHKAGTEVAQLYVAPPRRTHRLAGWARVDLAPGESRDVTLTADPALLLSYDAEAKEWVRGGDYRFFVGKSAGEPLLTGSATLGEARVSRQR